MKGKEVSSKYLIICLLTSVRWVDGRRERKENERRKERKKGLGGK